MPRGPEFEHLLADVRKARRPLQLPFSVGPALQHNPEVLEITTRAEWHLRRLLDRLERRWHTRERRIVENYYGHGEPPGTHSEYEAVTFDSHLQMEAVSDRLRELATERRARQMRTWTTSEREHRRLAALAFLEDCWRKGEEREAREAAEWGWSVEAYRAFMTCDSTTATRIRNHFYGDDWPTVREAIVALHGALSTGGKEPEPVFLTSEDMHEAYERYAAGRRVRSRSA